MVCLITGSSRGLGRAVALEFSNRGHKVVIHYRNNISEAEQTASVIKDSMVIKADVKSFKEVRSLIGEVIKKWGRVDILVNNAGITKEALLLKTSEQDFDAVVGTNLTGPFNLIRAAAPYMTKQKGGHVINISSVTGIKGREGLSVYSASKGGLIGLTLTAARELGRYNIMVNAVLPGYMLTEMGITSHSRAKERAHKDSLVEKFSEPGEVAKFIACLSETSGITGQVFNLDSRII